MLQLQNPNSDETMVTWEQLSASSGMAPNTIRDCYKMMLPYMAVVSAWCRRCQGRVLCCCCIVDALLGASSGHVMSPATAAVFVLVSSLASLWRRVTPRLTCWRSWRRPSGQHRHRAGTARQQQRRQRQQLLVVVADDCLMGGISMSVH